MQRTVRSEKQHSITNNRERNFVVRRHMITLLFILVALVGKAQVKSGLNLCLKDEATNDWLIGLFDDYAIYDCEYWNYAEVDKDHVVLTKDGQRKEVRLKKNAVIIDGSKHKTSVLTAQFLPDPDTNPRAALAAYGIRSYPELIVIDAKGTIVACPRNLEELESVLKDFEIIANIQTK